MAIIDDEFLVRNRPILGHFIKVVYSYNDQTLNVIKLEVQNVGFENHTITASFGEGNTLQVIKQRGDTMKFAPAAVGLKMIVTVGRNGVEHFEFPYKVTVTSPANIVS